MSHTLKMEIMNSTTDWWRPAQVGSGSPSWYGGAVTDKEGAQPGGIAFWALVAFTFVLILAPQTFIPALRHLHIAFLTAGIAGAAYMLGNAAYRRPIIHVTPEIVLAGCLAGWALASVPLSYWPGGSMQFLLNTFFKALIVFVLLVWVVSSQERLRIMAWSLTIIAVPLALSAVKSFFSGGFANQELTHGLDRITGYEAGLTANPNDLALMLNLILPVTIALLLGIRTPGLRTGLFLCAVLDIVAIIATYSRGGFLTLAIIMLLYLFTLLRRRKHGIAIFACVVSMLALPLLPSHYVTRLATITNIQSDRTGSEQARWQDMVTAMRFVMHHPVIGDGAGMNYLALNKMRGPTWKMVHNVYLEYAMDLGIPGLLIFIILMWKVISGTVRAKADAMSHQGTGLPYYLAEGTGISLMAFSVAALFYPDAYQFYFYFMAGYAIAIRRVIGQETGTPLQLPANWRTGSSQAAAI
jgi:O-antigen ligase